MNAQTETLVVRDLDSNVTNDWAAVKQLLNGLSVCWTDDSGLHIGDSSLLPPQTPAYCTHIWGSGDDRLVRVRIDGDRHHVAVLGDAGRGSGLEVYCRVESGLSWKTATGADAAIRLAPDTMPDRLGGAATAYVIVDGPRLTFLAG